MAALDYRPSRPWMEFILPVYALGFLLFYYRPESLPPPVQEVLLDGMFRWVLLGIVGALGGVLGLSALFLAFYLLYSPFYFLENGRRLLDRQAWVDQREVRFYLGCLILLVSLLILALVHLDAALVAFVLLAGFAQLVWRILV